MSDCKMSQEDYEKMANKEKEFVKELVSVINRYSKENGSDTPDFILAEYLIRCLQNFDFAVHSRSEWYGHHCTILGCNHSETQENNLK